MKEKVKKFITKKSLQLFWLWTAVILLLCSTPGNYIPSVSWLELLSFDKWVHASIFFIQCALLFVASQTRRFSKPLLIISFLLCILYGGALEVMQATLFSNRSADVLDFIANSIGCLIALFFRQRILGGIQVV